MSGFRAAYCDGRSSRAREVEAAIVGDHLRLRGVDLVLDYPLTAIALAPRVGSTPRRIGLPDGGQCETTDHAALERALASRRAGAVHRLQHRLESRLTLVLAALLLTVGFGWGMIEYGVPVLAREVAFALPREVDRRLGRGAFDTLDGLVLGPSRLDRRRRRALRRQFAKVIGAAQLDAPVEIRFRASAALGANALAFPSGTILFTDAMIEAAAADQELVGVLAHELGHLRQRHAVRAWLQRSVSALAFATLTGDVTSITAFAAALPTLLVEAKFSRAFETEADDYAVELLAELGVPPAHLANLLTRLSGEAATDDPGALGYLSSHPATRDRLARLKRGA